MLGDLDVCCSKFSFQRAESEIKKQKGRMLCDVLLDQAVLPGVGNIIKNEALYDSGLHPIVKVCKIFLVAFSCILHFAYDDLGLELLKENCSVHNDHSVTL